MGKEKRELSAVERIIQRGSKSGGSQWSWNEGKYVQFPPLPKGVGKGSSNILFRYVSPNYQEVKLHFFTQISGGIRVDRCALDKNLAASFRHPCIHCFRADRILKKNPKSNIGSRLRATTKWLFNVIPFSKEQERYYIDEDGTKRTRIISLSWMAFEALGMILAKNSAAIGGKDHSGDLFKITKTVTSKTEYRLEDVGSPRVLTPSELALARWDLKEEYMPLPNDTLSECLGVNIEEEYKKMKSNIVEAEGGEGENATEKWD